jgi:hypothetical protein
VEATLVVMGVPEGKLLASMRRNERIVDVEHLNLKDMPAVSLRHHGGYRGFRMRLRSCVNPGQLMTDNSFPRSHLNIPCAGTRTEHFRSAGLYIARISDVRAPSIERRNCTA